MTDDAGRRRQLRIVVERQRPHTELRPAAGDVDFVAFDGDLDFAGAHRTNDVGRQTRRQHHAAVSFATDGQRQLDRQIEIGAGDAQPVADEFEAQPRQHRQCPGSTGSSSSCSGERFGKSFAFATELHREAFLTMR